MVAPRPRRLLSDLFFKDISLSHSTARGTDPASLPLHATANSSKLPLIARRGGHRRRRLLQILVVPCQISLEPVADVTGPADAVILVGINHELSLDAETAQRLVHLLASGQRHVEIALTAQKERRGFDSVSVEEWV